MSWHWNANCNTENPSVCFLLATTDSNSSLSICSRKNISGQGQPSNPISLRQGCFARASRVLGIGLDRHFSSRMLDKIKAYWSLEQSIDPNLTMYFFTLAALGWQCLTLFFFRNHLESITAFMVQVCKKRIKKYTRWKLHRVFLERCVVVTIFSNWYWNFQPARLLVSYNRIFRVGSTWLTLLPLLQALQILKPYNNQYPWPLDTLPSLQRCQEGILLSFLLLCPTESLWISVWSETMEIFAVDFRSRIYKWWQNPQEGS